MRVFLSIALVLLTACSQKKTATSTTNAIENTDIFFKSATQLTVQVAYEPGAEPYTETLTARPSSPSVWWILEENLNALYLGRPNPPVINVPRTLAEFQALPSQNKAHWTANDLLALANSNRTGRSSTDHSYFWVVFLNGHFHDGSTAQPGVVGVSITGTTILAIFKDVVKSSSNGLAPVVSYYVEQSTLVHEMGHALGLVNNGLPMHQPHQDSAHGAHCDNPDCVMFWLNEGASDLRSYIVRLLLPTGNTRFPILFDDKCLEDSRKF